MKRISGRSGRSAKRLFGPGGLLRFFDEDVAIVRWHRLRLAVGWRAVRRTTIEVAGVHRASMLFSIGLLPAGNGTANRLALDQRNSRYSTAICPLALERLLIGHNSLVLRTGLVLVVVEGLATA